MTTPKTGGGSPPAPPDGAGAPQPSSGAAPAMPAGTPATEPSPASPPAASPGPSSGAAETASSSSGRAMSFPAYVPPGAPGALPEAAAQATPPAAPSPPDSAGDAIAGTLSDGRDASRADAAELPELPTRYDENELRAAVGASPLPARGTPRPSGRDDERGRDREDEDDDDDDGSARQRPRRGLRSIAGAALAIAAVLGTALLVFLGYVNRGRYLLQCEAERAVPAQGRGFPPWGARAMSEPKWRPLPIAPATRCQPQETDDPLVIERAFLAMVLDQATSRLTAREVTKVDDAEALLRQALLLTRPPESEPAPLAAQRSEHHQEVERLLGDVAYWRAVAKLRDAAAALGDAARQFDAAVAQHPRHVSDAGAWAAYVRRLAHDLQAGPASPPSPGAPAAGSGSAPAGPAASPGAAPTVPGTPAGPAPSSPATGSATVPAERPAGAAPPVDSSKPGAPPPQAAPPPDAGPPTGGVLL